VRIVSVTAVPQSRELAGEHAAIHPLTQAVSIFGRIRACPTLPANDRQYARPDDVLPLARCNVTRHGNRAAP